MASSSPDRRLTRSTDDRLLAGVAAGAAEFLGVDVTLVRVGFVLLALFGGSGFVLYLAMWLLVPPADGTDRPVDENLRAGVGEVREAAEGLARDIRTGWRGGDAGDGDAEGSGGGDVPPTTDG